MTFRIVRMAWQSMAVVQISGGDRSMTMREKIFSQIEQIAKERDKGTFPHLTDDIMLLESGLDSLELAILVARLEDQLGLDPFSSEDEVDLPVTFGDFVRLYEIAHQGNQVAKLPSASRSNETD